MLKEVTKNQDLCKLIYYNEDSPLDEIDIANPNTLLLTSLFPYPFNPKATIEDCVQLRIWIPEAKFKNRVIENIDILFDIVMFKDLFLIYIDGDPKLRAYEIMAEITNIFNDKSIETIGMLHFDGFMHITVNDKFDCFRLPAKMMNLS